MPQEKKNKIYETLLRQKVDIVLTAHPTEVNRRTLLRKYRSISEKLAELDRMVTYIHTYIHTYIQYIVMMIMDHCYSVFCLSSSSYMILYIYTHIRFLSKHRLTNEQDVTPYEKSQSLYALKREIASIWCD